MKTRNTRIPYSSVVEKISALHRGKIPEHLMKNNAQRNGKEFDPNSYFSVLMHLSMKDGYTMDYVYHYMSDFAGEPCLYARRVGDTPLRSYIKHREWEEKNDLSSYLIADGTPDSFFELIVFRRLAGQYYLFWHVNYNDLKVITSASDVEGIIAEVNGGRFGANFSEAQIGTVRSLDAQPRVEFTDDAAAVTYCIFTKWGGFARLKESFRRTPPHKLIDREVLGEVKYNCGVCF